MKILPAIENAAFSGRTAKSFACGMGLFDALKRECDAQPPYEGLSLFGSIPVHVSKCLPADVGVLVGADGAVLAWFGPEDPKRKENPTNV